MELDTGISEQLSEEQIEQLKSMVEQFVEESKFPKQCSASSAACLGSMANNTQIQRSQTNKGVCNCETEGLKETIDSIGQFSLSILESLRISQVQQRQLFEDCQFQVKEIRRLELVVNEVTVSLEELQEKHEVSLDQNEALSVQIQRLLKIQNDGSLEINHFKEKNYGQEKILQDIKRIHESEKQQLQAKIIALNQELRDLQQMYQSYNRNINQNETEYFPITHQNTQESICRPSNRDENSLMFSDKSLSENFTPHDDEVFYPHQEDECLTFCSTLEKQINECMETEQSDGSPFLKIHSKVQKNEEVSEFIDSTDKQNRNDCNGHEKPQPLLKRKKNGKKVGLMSPKHAFMSIKYIKNKQVVNDKKSFSTTKSIQCDLVKPRSSLSFKGKKSKILQIEKETQNCHKLIQNHTPVKSPAWTFGEICSKIVENLVTKRIKSSRNR